MVRLGTKCPLGVMLGFSILLNSQPATADTTPGLSVPEGLSVPDWSNIRTAYEANRHRAFAVDGGYQARNPGQQWHTRFDGRGFVTIPDAGGWSWGLELVSYGRGDEQCAATLPSCMDAQGGRIEYEWDDTLTEWYLNDARGFEHGYTIRKRPRGDASLLSFVLTVRGDLQPSVSRDGRDVAFVNVIGAGVVSYHGLTVFDADGVGVPAWFEPSSAGLQININDQLARYPLTVDPIAQQAYLKASNTGLGDQFGASVAVSEDTVVVGAFGEDSGATGVNGSQADNSASNSGAAYVFVRDGTGNWSQQAYLKASNSEADDWFGHSVSVSGDTVVVGASGEDSDATDVNGIQDNNLAVDSGAAYVFVRDGNGNWSQQVYLKASNTNAGDSFGTSVSASGETVVVGAHTEDSIATGVGGDQTDNSSGQAGAAYVFVRDGKGNWSQQAYLKASNTGELDLFGVRVAITGESLVVGAFREDSGATGVNGNQSDNSATDSGAAYVFARDEMGNWSQQAYLKASNTGAGDYFGYSVAASDTTLVVGSFHEDSSATGIDGNQADDSAANSGAAYVFVRDAMGDWSQQAYLKASNTGVDDNFGHSLAVSGDTVAVGAFGEDSSTTGIDGNQADNGAAGSGAAYVFVRQGLSNWSQQAYLKASNTGSGDQFGSSVAVGGDTVVVGAIIEDSNAIGVNGNQANNSASNSGAAYVFTGTGCPTLGNMNCDCAVNVEDVSDFVQALLDPAGYTTEHPTCGILRGDMQPDGIVDGADISGFVQLVIDP